MRLSLKKNFQKDKSKMHCPQCGKLGDRKHLFTYCNTFECHQCKLTWTSWQQEVIDNIDLLLNVQDVSLDEMTDILNEITEIVNKAKSK